MGLLERGQLWRQQFCWRGEGGWSVGFKSSSKWKPINCMPLHSLLLGKCFRGSWSYPWNTRPFRVLYICTIHGTLCRDISNVLYILIDFKIRLTIQRKSIVCYLWTMLFGTGLTVYVFFSFCFHRQF